MARKVAEIEEVSWFWYSLSRVWCSIVSNKFRM